MTLYVFPTCGSPCGQAREFLNKRGIPYAEKNVATEEEIAAFKAASGDISMPALTVGKTWLKGFLDTRWNQELDYAGYPKSAPPRPVAAVKPKTE